MEPRIQYAKTSDGVSIAYWVLGKGMPLVYASSPPFNHLQMEWQIPQLRLLFERLARGRMLVKYDHRGCGLSQRDVQTTRSTASCETWRPSLTVFTYRASTCWEVFTLALWPSPTQLGAPSESRA